jgi:hypothetical protein
VVTFIGIIIFAIIISLFLVGVVALCWTLSMKGLEDVYE